MDEDEVYWYVLRELQSKGYVKQNRTDESSKGNMKTILLEVETLFVLSGTTARTHLRR